MRSFRHAMWATIFVTAVGPPAISATCFAQESAATPDDALAELHAAAKQARDAKDFATVEDLRLKRLNLIGESETKSPWTAGAEAIATADSQIKAMRYEQACATLTEAWKAFENPPRGEPVFGDIALKLFEAVQAAKAVFPDFAAVSTDQLRKALRLAAEADPCQTEALVADAFLTGLDAAEAFEPAPLRASLRARSKLLSTVSPSPDLGQRPLPWHAPAEWLRADANRFVLDDLDYYHGFLDPRRRLQGIDRQGDPVHIVMAGSLLATDRDEQGTRKPIVIDYDAERGVWVRMKPRILRVQPPGSKSEPWRIDEPRLIASLRDMVEAAIAERQTSIKRRLLTSAEGLQGAVRVKADIRKILAFMKEPPKSREPLKLEEVFQMVQAGFGNYLRVNPDEATKVAAAQKQVQELSEEWQRFKTGTETLRAAVGDPDATNRIDPQRAASALADFLKVVGAAGPTDRDAAESEAAEDAPNEGKDKKEKPPSQLSGRELRLRMSRDKNLYDLLALFKLMTSTHRQAIQGVLATALPPPPPGGSLPSRQDRARAAAHARLAESLQELDGLLTFGTTELATGSVPTPFSLTLDQLLQAGSLAKDMAAALRALGNDSEQTRFLTRLAETIDAVAGPATREAALQRYCTKANRARSWQVGRAAWRIYDFPASTSAETIADLIDHSQRVAFAAADLDAILAEPEADAPPTDANVPLRRGCTTTRSNRLVRDRNGSLSLEVLSNPGEPCTMLLLDVDASADAASPPAFLASSDGPALAIVIDGKRLKTAVASGEKNAPELVVDFSGPQGRVPLGAKADAFADVRFMVDHGGNRVVRDRAPVKSPQEAHFYAVTSKSGDLVTDRTLNYVIEDWLDLDRKNLESHLPSTMFSAPSLPAWREYRRDFMRPAPDDGWMWQAPQRAIAP